MAEIALEIQRQIIENKLGLWRNTIYDAQLDAKVAEIIGDEGMKTNAAERLKRALKATDALEQIVRELQENQ